MLIQRYLLNLRLFTLMLGIAMAGSSLPAQSLQDSARAVAEGLKSGTVSVSGYKRSLAHEALLRWAATTDQRDWIDWVLVQEHDRSLRPREPFNCPEWWLSQVSGDNAWLKGLLAENLQYREFVSRSREGAIEHPRGKQRGGGQALLIDAVQDYSFRMAVTAHLTGESAYGAEAVEQYRLYRRLLRDPESGLWSQGRGWLSDPDALSPGFWSRGQGWLIRGMVDTLLLLPEDSTPAVEMRGYLREFADALLRYQQSDGMWHCLLNRKPEESPPEVSGSALIAGYFGIALAHGFLEGEPYAAAAKRTFAALPAYVDPDGTVRSVSPGPGPLETEAPWQVDTFPSGDEHGPFSIFFAALGEKLLGEHIH